MSAHALYRFYGTDGELLYVGITMNPGARWKQHANDKSWWHDVTNITIEHHLSRAAALAAEREAIIAEQPMYNVAHNRSRMESAGGLPSRPESMPDDCHDHCAKIGIYSIYYPHRWANGIAHYTCHAGHHWTCWWAVDGSGEAERSRCNPVLQEYDAALLAATRDRAQAAIDSYRGDDPAAGEEFSRSLRLRAIACEALLWAERRGSLRVHAGGAA